MLRVTPVYGSRWDKHGTAPSGSCTLIEYAGVSILLNAGECSSADFDFAELPEHDCLLISDSTLASVGNLPLYYKKQAEQNRIPNMYATFPTVKMGQMALYDKHANLSLDGASPPFSLEELDEAVSQLQTIKYSQAIYLPSVEDPQLSITAHRAGHVVGGAFFVLQRVQDETVVVVTATYNVAKELHLDSSTLLQHASTPDVLVTRPGGPSMRALQALYSPSSSSGNKKNTQQAPPLVSQVQRQLVEHILSVLRRDGNTLLPVDASGRSLELILLLSQHWEKHRLSGTYNLVWLGPMVGNTIEFGRSQLEWMNVRLGKQLEQSGSALNPFALKGVTVCSSAAELDRISQNGNPSCVVASGLSLDHGPARDLLLKWADNDNHAVIFTDSAGALLRKQMLDEKQKDSANSSNNEAAAALAPESEETAEDTLAGEAIASGKLSKYTTSYQLLLHWAKAQVEDREMDDSIDIDVLLPRRVPLAGQELTEFLEMEDAALKSKRRKEEELAMLREVEIAKGQLRLGEDIEKENASGSGMISPKKQTATSRSGRSKKSRFDQSLFLKFSKPLHLMFEVREEAIGIGQTDSTAKFGGIGEMGNNEVLEDDYGIAVEPDHFVDVVSGVDPSKFAGGSGRIGEDVLRRGFGYGVDQAQGSKKRKTVEDGSGENDEAMDEAALEAADLSEGRGIIRGRGGRPPTKVMTVPRRLLVLAEISYFPLEGRVSSRAARQSVRALQPRKVIVLGGCKVEDDDSSTDESDIETPNEAQLLADAAKGFASSGSLVPVPTDMETAELEVGHAAYSVRLIDTPYRSKEEKESEEEAPDPMELFEAKLGSCSVSLLDFVATGQKVAADGSIVLAPRRTAGMLPSLYLSEGEVLLTDLRSELIAKGFKAEYSTHSGFSRLVVNGKVVVKKEKESARLQVEGPLCEDFFAVRSVVCSQYISL